MPIILPTQSQDLDIAEDYALSVSQADPRKNPETFYFGALGELAFARWDGPETYERCVEHLRRAASPTKEDWRYDFVTKNSYLVDVTYVQVSALDPSARVFEFSGWIMGSEVIDLELKPLARDNHKFLRVRREHLNPVDKW